MNTAASCLNLLRALTWNLLCPLSRRALRKADISKEEIDAVAVTYGPGLAGSLIVGLSFAKAFAAARGIPVVGVNHMEGHLYSSFLEEEKPQFPFVALIVSGGHTMLVHVNEPYSHEVLGQTRDDAAGEAFDKVAKASWAWISRRPRYRQTCEGRKSKGSLSFHVRS